MRYGDDWNDEEKAAFDVFYDALLLIEADRRNFANRSIAIASWEAGKIYEQEKPWSNDK